MIKSEKYYCQNCFNEKILTVNAKYYKKYECIRCKNHKSTRQQYEEKKQFDNFLLLCVVVLFLMIGV